MQKKYLYSTLPSALLFCVFLLPGCDSGRPKTEHINGTVTCNENVVEGALVAMTPKDDPKGIPAFGRTDVQGRYTITTLRGGREGGGAQIGDYRVTVTKEVPGREMTARERTAFEEHGVTPNIEPVNILPKRYARADTSGLEVHVEKGKNTFNFDLTDE